jgi:enamine deaminase RidA (YjgF/YER057c/UK114 family)
VAAVTRECISSGTEWEDAVGYSRAVRAGDKIHVSGTTGTDDSGELVGVGDPYAQTAQAIENIDSALEEAGAELADVVRTRMYVTDVGQWEAIGRTHREALESIRPTTTMLQIDRLIEPKMCIEIEAGALVAD